MTPRLSDSGGPRLSPTVRAHLTDARDCLEEAAAARTSAARYVAAHLAALRAAAAVLAARPRPMEGRRRRRLRSAWEMLPEAEPRLAEWAPYFETSAAKRAAAEAGLTRTVSSRDAEELVSEAERFVTTVEKLLGVPSQPLLPGEIPLAG
ncbi:hypothetical protein GCM10022252_15250 [Streptosporangium oxazolinicum]|uniref:SAV-6107-like HEPN domain-containing protein n=1 Tax=Streptosporangium oxazolinicum TaxID=909287 RepID=A0ABP8AJX3_9ACTN